MLEDTEDEIEGANITILPPDMGAGSDTDGDSGDEMVATGDPNSLSRNQLLAEACVEVRRRHDEDDKTSDEEEADPADPPAAQPPVKKAKSAQHAEDVEPAKVTSRKTQPKVKLAEYRPSWVKKDLNLAHGKT